VLCTESAGEELEDGRSTILGRLLEEDSLDVGEGTLLLLVVVSASLERVAGGEQIQVDESVVAVEEVVLVVAGA